MEQTPGCEHCRPLEQELARCQQRLAEQDAQLCALEQLLRTNAARLQALEQRLLALTRGRRP